jgi:polysaccharide biosynthesis transport protein
MSSRASDKDGHFRPEDDYDVRAAYGTTLIVRDIRFALRRSWLLPVLGCLIGLAPAILFASTFPSRYQSTATILVDRSVHRYLQTNKIITEPIQDYAELASQIHILTSESVVLPVVRSLNLANDPEFVGSSSAEEADRMWTQQVRNLWTAAKQYIGWKSAKAEPTDRERVAVSVFLKRLSVFRADVANVINVTFESEDANKAAMIANAVADTYVSTTQAARATSLKVANQLLQDRLVELKGQAIEADQALQNYKVANNLMYSEKGLPLYDELLSELVNVTGQLTKARVAAAEAKARRERIQAINSSGGNELSSEITSSASLAPDSILAQLRAEYMQLASRAADIEPRVESGHNALVKIERRMETLRNLIRAEDERQIAIDYENAKTRENELTASVERLIAGVRQRSLAQVNMRDLESASEAARSLYSNLLQKFQEISATHAQEIDVQDVRVVTRATPPLYKSSKKVILALAGGLAVGLFLGAGAAVARELMADVFRSPDRITETTGFHSDVLPLIKPKKFSSTPNIVEEFVLEEPYSRFAETLRGVKALIDASGHGDDVKVIGVVSSLPNEGKTTIAANLGALIIAASIGEKRVLVIDGDFHLRSLTAKLAPNARVGLIEALADPSQLGEFVSTRPRSKLDVLPCVLAARLPNAAELAGSPQMERLLHVARETYDFVLVEIPPILSVVDLKRIERFIDRFVYVVEWGQTKRRVVLEAQADVPMIRDRIVSVVLNKADPKALRSIESYKGTRYHDYYQS